MSLNSDEDYHPLEGTVDYEVTNQGRIWSNKSNKFLTTNMNHNGYKVVATIGKLRLSSLVHIHVAKAFVPNPDNKPFVNHKDSDRMNAKADNLEWVTRSENGLHSAKANPDFKKEFMRPVEQYDIETDKVLQTFEGLRIACRALGIPVSSVSSVLRGKSKSLYGKGWRYTPLPTSIYAKIKFVIELDETWVVISEFPNYYIDRKGNVYSTHTKNLLSQHPDLKGYTLVYMHRDGKQWGRYTHRLVSEAFIPNPEDKKFVNHIDGNPRNNVLENLEWVTASENAIHAISTGLRHTRNVIQLDKDI